jgi:hypothetical protein
MSAVLIFSISVFFIYDTETQENSKASLLVSFDIFFCCLDQRYQENNTSNQEDKTTDECQCIAIFQA